jgi:urease accessory protein
MQAHLVYRLRFRLPLQMAVGACALFALTASAHTGLDPHSHANALQSFAAGMSHPLTGLDHWLAMLAVGLWSALSLSPGNMHKNRLRQLFRAPGVFVAALLAGAVAGLAGWSAPLMEPLIAASVLVLGLLVLARSAFSHIVSLLLVGVFALFHGLAHGTELATLAHPLYALAGMLMATSALHLVGLWTGWQLRTRPLWMGRMLGMVITLFGAQWVWAAI